MTLLQVLLALLVKSVILNVPASEVINPYPFRVILDSQPCGEEQILVVVHSSPKLLYSRRRTMLRATWLQPTRLVQLLEHPVKVIFVLGLGENDEQQRYIEYESEMYGDIVQSDFIDSYRNNTYKAMSFLRWTADHCSKAKVLLKMDDDVLLHPHKSRRLKSLLAAAIVQTTPFYIGKLVEDSRPVRDVTSKWYMSYEEWPDSTYPIWYQGLAFLLSPTIAAKLFLQSLSTSYLFTDDVYMGILVDGIQKTENIDIRTNVALRTFKITCNPEQDELNLRFVNTCALLHLPNFSQYWWWAHHFQLHGS